MKKFILGAIVFTMLFACCHHEKDECCSKGKDMKAQYEKNLATVKAAVAAFEKKDMDAFSTFVADDVVWHSPAYGDTVTTKAHWLETLKMFQANWTSFQLNDYTYLPGVDSATMQMDGSVRYYGRWDGVHKSGTATHTNFYGTYDFNKDNKIVDAAEYFDLGGMMMAVGPKAK